ncbi:MAG: thioesterase family protein [Chloroflexi bacterium]|nr:thioesterase family protein [Chloroflexota bacterium]
MDQIQPGMVGEIGEVVTEDLTAGAKGSGLVPAYATPAMVDLMEKASIVAMKKSMGPGQTSVGTEVNVKHLAATPIGMRVRARSEVTAVEGRRVTFKVEAWDDKEKIGEGTHGRAVVDDARFRDRLSQKAKS